MRSNLSLSDEGRLIMCNTQAKVLVALVVCAGMVSLGWARTLRTKAGRTGPTVSQLVSRIQQSQEQGDKIHSYIVKWEVTGEGRCSFMGGGRRKMRVYKERVTDGKRFYYCEKKWGNCLMGEDILITKDDPKVRAWLWDGQTYFFWGKLPTVFIEQLARRRFKTADERAEFVQSRAGSVSIRGREPAKPPAHNALINISMGHLQGDVERIDKILRQADTISVRKEMERVGESLCYVIDAVSRHGKHKVWIDPEHGYNIARARVLKGPGHIKIGAWGQPETLSYSLDNVRFRKIDDVWVAMEADRKYDEKYASGDFMTSDTHYRQIEVVFDPNHEARRSFDPNIPDGWKVRFKGFQAIDGKQEFTWRDGAVVNGKGGKVDFLGRAAGPKAEHRKHGL